MDSGAEALRKHAELMWKAEEVNASRLASRANLVLSVATAVLGLQLYSLGSNMEFVLQQHIGFRLVFFWLSMLASVIGMIEALRRILGIKFDDDRDPNDPRSASDLLQLDALDTEGSILNTTPDQMTRYLYVVTYSAAQDLNTRNEDRRISIDRAQIALFVAGMTTILSIILYLTMQAEHTIPAFRNFIEP